MLIAPPGPHPGRPSINTPPGVVLGGLSTKESHHSPSAVIPQPVSFPFKMLGEEKYYYKIVKYVLTYMLGIKIIFFFFLSYKLK